MEKMIITKSMLFTINRELLFLIILLQFVRNIFLDKLTNGANLFRGLYSLKIIVMRAIAGVILIMTHGAEQIKIGYL